MNQILSTNVGNSYRKTNKIKYYSGPKGVLKVFAMLLLIFGISMIGTASYGIHQSQVKKEEENIKASITIEDKSDSEILLKVTHQRIISKVEYYWNDEDPVVVNGKNGNYLEVKIDVPSGQNKLHVIVTDETGYETPYERDFDIESKININIDDNGQIRITDSSDTKISYMTYRWDEEEEEKIDINSNELDEKIDARSGKHKLTVVVVDENNKADTKAQVVNGITKPEVELSIDDSEEHFVVTAKSEESKITELIITLDKDENQNYRLNLKDRQLNEMQYVLPDQLALHDGDNYIKVVVYNEDGLSTEKAAHFSK